MFPGSCAEALDFYRDLFGGELRTFTYGASPMADSVPPEWRDKLLHATLTIGEQTIMGVDMRPDQFQRPQGFYVVFSPKTKQEAERVFAVLSEGGAVQMPLQDAFWSPAFGVLTDRFGIPWEINCEAAPAA
jgi:PhnB protein